MKKIVLLYCIVVTFLLGVDAELDIVRKGSIIPTIGVSVTNKSMDADLAKKIKDVLEQDFSVSGHFHVEDVTLKSDSIRSSFDFFNPAYSKLDLVLLLEIKNSLNNAIVVDVSLQDINSKITKLLTTYQIGNQKRYPFLAHKIAIGINNELKAPSIDWMDRFILISKYTSSKKSEIIVADYTLTYQQVVVNGGLNIFPKWANKEQTSFYYTTFDKLYPTLIKQDLYSRKSEKILYSDGMAICSDVSKNGNKLLVTLAPNGQPDIYEYNLLTKEKERITKYSGIDVGANYLGNEDKIVFVSDRLGKANIFSQSIGANNIQRLVYHGQNNTQATAYNNYIIYSGREEGRSNFNLYLISTENNNLKKLTSSGANQFPKFSQDGESVLYVKNQGGKSSLGIIRLDYNKHFLFPLNIGKIQSIDW